MKEFNCPDCMVGGDSCEFCQRAALKVSNQNPIPTYSPLSTPPIDCIPECCRYCSNHPINGGSGICHCVLPYMTTTNPSSYQPYYTTTSTDFPPIDYPFDK